MRQASITDLDNLFAENPACISNKARRNLINREIPWLSKEESGRLLGIYLPCKKAREHI